MITHITVEDAAKLISRLTNANEMQALTYIREAADRGEIQTADALEKLQAENAQLRAELERVTAERDGAEKEITRLKAIMREKGIFTIPAKYPWEAPEWNW